MEKIHRGAGFAIIERNGEYLISWAQGPYNEPVFYPISKLNMDKAFKSDQDAYEVMIYAETGNGLQVVEKQIKINKTFGRRSSKLLLSIPDN